MSFPPTGSLTKTTSEIMLSRNNEKYNSRLDKKSVSEPVSLVKRNLNSKLSDSGNFLQKHVKKQNTLIRQVFPGLSNNEIPTIKKLLSERKINIHGTNFDLQTLTKHNIRIFRGTSDNSRIIGSGKFGTVVEFKSKHVFPGSPSHVFKEEKFLDHQTFMASFKNPNPELPKLFPLQDGFLHAPLRAKIAYDLARELKLEHLLPHIEVGINEGLGFGTLMTQVNGLTADEYLRNLHKQERLIPDIDINNVNLKTLLDIGMIDTAFFSEIILFDYLCGRHDRSKLQNIMVTEIDHKTRVILIDMDLCFPTGNDLLHILFSECSFYSDFIVYALQKMIPTSDSDSDSDSDGSLNEEQKKAIVQKQIHERDLVTSKLHKFGTKVKTFLGQESYQAYIARVNKIVGLMVIHPCVRIEQAGGLNKYEPN